MYKRGTSILVSLLIVSFMLMGTVFAQSNSTNNSSSSNTPQLSNDIIDKAYQCLNTQISNKAQSELSLQEAIFSTLALGSQSKLQAVIDSKSTGSNHWGDSGNQIKDTAQVLLAYKRAGKNIDSIVSWLLSNERTAIDLTWYLEVDTTTHSASQCTLKYGTEQRTITINADQTLSGNGGSCLSVSSNGYWLRVTNTNVCVNMTYDISCDLDFVTTQLYQRSGSSTTFVSSGTHSAAALGTTHEQINSKCFSVNSAGCDYEGTLWAAYALDSASKEVSKYLPYLLALSDANPRYLPSAILYKLTSGQDQYSLVVQSQQQSKYWQAPNTPYNRYYDSALAMLALSTTSAGELNGAQEYFKSIVTSDGCWNNNNIRDTAFLLYASWPRGVVLAGNGGSVIPTSNTCEESGHYCTSVFVCNDISGSVFSSYTCASGVCCSKKQTEKTCADQSGKICKADETCSGSNLNSIEGSCCVGTCDALPEVSECETKGGSCYATCQESEEQLTATCSGTDLCCKKAEATTSSSGGFWNIWIILLIILIILVAIAIIFRHKLQLWFYKMKGSSSSSSSSQVRPGFPPSGRPPFPPSRGPIPVQARAQSRIINPSTSPSRRIGVSKGDDEMEETMRKLREMGK